MDKQFWPKGPRFDFTPEGCSLLLNAGWNINGFVKSPPLVMPDLIPAEDGIFDRHPELTGITEFRLSPE